MGEIDIRIEGRAGRITLTRPKALNALTYGQVQAITAALADWRDDGRVALVIIDAEGERAFCAGGDLAEMYATGRAGDFGYGRRFWQDEYRMNAQLAEYAKPVVSLMQGFVMGGGVGLGCHVAHRIVGESTQMAMPECGIGLIPDVGGTYLLARAPGRLGLYLGLSGARMGPGDALLAGFADHFVPEATWPALCAELAESGDAGRIAAHARPAPEAALAAAQRGIDAAFGGAGDGAELVARAIAALTDRPEDWAALALKALGRNSPLSMACTAEMVRSLPRDGGIRPALTQEYRWTWRSMEAGDFLEGVRAQIIDKDRNPHWRHADLAAVTRQEIAAMLAPLGADELTFEEE